MAAKKAFARSAFRDATEYFQIAMDAVDKQPASTAGEQRAIDLGIEARLAFASLGSIEQWFGIVAMGKRDPRKSATKATACVDRDQGGRAEFLRNAL